MSRPSELVFDPNTGAISIEGYAITLCSGMTSNTVLAALSSCHRNSINHQNGYEWLSFDGLSFANHPCALSICFNNGRLTEMHWGLKTSAPEGWPTREAIEQEVAFVRSALKEIFSRPFSSGRETFPWGQVWSHFDPKGFLASSGVRYAA